VSDVSEHPAVSLIRRCEAAVREGALREEAVYADSTQPNWSRAAFASAREALEYEFQAVVREIKAKWTSLGTPADAAGFPNVVGSERWSKAVSTAFFPKDRLLGYAILRETPMERVTLTVGVVEAFDREPSGTPGEGDAAQVGIQVGKWVM
jgi:hypothetical protein